MKKGMILVGILGVLMFMPTVVNASEAKTTTAHAGIVGVSIHQVKAAAQTKEKAIIAPVVETQYVPTTSNHYTCPYGNEACNQNGSCINNGQCQYDDTNHRGNGYGHNGMGHRGGGQGYHNGNHHN